MRRKKVELVTLPPLRTEGVGERRGAEGRKTERRKNEIGEAGKTEVLKKETKLLKQIEQPRSSPKIQDPRDLKK